MWKCLNCGESLNDVYDTCWKCSFSKNKKITSQAKDSSLEIKLKKYKEKIEKGGIFSKRINVNDDSDTIIRDILSKYLQHKNPSQMVYLLSSFLGDKEMKRHLKKHSLDGLETIFKQLLVKNDSITYPDTDALDRALKAKQELESALELTGDLKNIFKLLQKKNVETDYLQLISILHEIAKSKFDEELNKNITTFLRPVTEAIPRVLGDDMTVESVMRHLVKIRFYRNWIIDDKNIEKVITMIKLLEKLGFEYDSQEAIDSITIAIEMLVAKIKEEIEIEDFEQSLTSGKKENHAIEDYSSLNGYEFEKYLKKLFKELGYTAIQTSLSGDQGADLVMSKDGKKIVVQAKKYTGKVANKAVQEVIAAKGYYNTEEAIVITNSSFTESAKELALKCNVELWDGKKLKDVIGNLQKNNKNNFVPTLATVTYSSGESEKKVKLPCPSCETDFDYLLIWEDLEEKTSIETYCPNCGMGVHSAPFQWPCDICGKKFSTLKSFKIHREKCASTKEKK